MEKECNMKKNIYIPTGGQITIDTIKTKEKKQKNDKGISAKHPHRFLYAALRTDREHFLYEIHGKSRYRCSSVS